MDSEKEDGWFCPTCTYLNASYQRRCEMCNSRPTGQAPTATVSEDTYDAEKEPSTGDKWSNTGITYLNPSGSSRKKFDNEPNKHTDETLTFQDMDEKLKEIDLDSELSLTDFTNPEPSASSEKGFAHLPYYTGSFTCQDKDQNERDIDLESETKPTYVAKRDSPNRNDWSCTRCTYLNPVGKLKCEMCEGPKPTTKPLPFEDSDRTMTENDSDFEKEIRIVLIGKTGSGKSATGNTILGQDAFKSVSSFSSVTQKCSSGSNNRFGEKLLVVDTPGLFDTGMTNGIITKEIVKCIGMTSPGPHAIVLVVAVGRFTKEDQDTVQHFSHIFGEGMFNHMIVLFTRRDDLERQNDTIQSCVQNAAPELKELLRKCHQRYIAFDNNQAPAMREEDAMTLIQMIHDITQSNGGKSYSNEMYEEAEKQYRRRTEEIERQNQREKERIEQMLKKEFRQKIDKANKEKQRILEKCREKDRQIRSFQFEIQQSTESLAKKYIFEEIKRLQKEKEKYENQIHQAEERGRQWEAEHRRREQKLLHDVESKYQMEICKMRSDIRREYEEEHKGIIPSLFGVVKSIGVSVFGNWFFK